MQENETQRQIAAFLDGAPHAVVGASRDRAKYGNKVLRVYLQNDLPVYAVNPAGGKIEGVHAYPSLRDLPAQVHGISIITPPAITERIIEQAAELGIKHVWMQPGAESPAAVEAARGHDMNVIAGDACILVVLGYHEH